MGLPDVSLPCPAPSGDVQSEETMPILEEETVLLVRWSLLRGVAVAEGCRESMLSREGMEGARVELGEAPSERTHTLA